MSERSECTRVIVQIKRVWLAVRFNCKLAFIIRNQLSEKIAETDSTYALFRGECLVNETLYFQLPQEVLAARAKKLKLVVMMISANGMVPAGFVSFATQWRSPYEQFQVIVPLERCEDSRAQIKFMHMYQSCSRTPLEQSFINNLIARQDRHLTDNIALLSRAHQPSSHSLNRHMLTARKSQVHEQPLASRAQLPKSPISPRLTLRDSQPGTSEKSVGVATYKKSEQECRIVEEANESSINPLTKEQLVKEHQQYWLEIIKMEEEMEILKEENRTLKQQNQTITEENALLKADTSALKDYYEGHEEKIHALLGQIQQNTQTIKALQAQLADSRNTLKHKEQLEREVVEAKKSLEKHAQLQEQLQSATQAHRTAANKLEMLQQTVTFLQTEVRKYQEENVRLSARVNEDKDRLYFLTHNNETQKNFILQLEAKVSKLAHQDDTISALQHQNDQLKLQITYLQDELEGLKQTDSKGREVLQTFEQQPMVQEEEIETLKLQYTLQQQQAEAKHAQELQQIKAYYESREKELEQATKERDHYKQQLAKREEETNLIKDSLLRNEEEVKALQNKLIQSSTSLTGIIQQLRQKNQSLEKEFEEMERLLEKEMEEKNKITIMLTTLEDNLRTIDEERAQLANNQQLLHQKNLQLTNTNSHLASALHEADKNHKVVQQQLQTELTITQEQLAATQEQLKLSQEQLGDVIQKANAVEQQLQSTLAQFEELKSTRITVRDQYQQSYNQSMTAITLRNAKLEKELQELKRTIEREREQNKPLSEKIIAKQSEISEIKGFTHARLQENLKLMKQNQELKAKQAEAQETSKKLHITIEAKDAQLAILSKKVEELKRQQQNSFIKIEQLTSELQFVTEVLQRERQEKSDIQKEMDHLEKTELPQIEEVGQLKEESFDEHRHDDVHLQIESKVNTPNQQVLPKEEAKAENHKKKKKRN